MEKQYDYKDYEYLTVTASTQNASETANRYSSLGWVLESQMQGLVKKQLTFRRERNIKNKEQLLRLQVRIQDGVDRIDELEQGKKYGAGIFALTFGILAALIFGGGLSLAMFSFQPLVVWSVIVGIALGMVGGALAAITYPLYARMAAKKTAKTIPLIEAKRDELFDLCKEASNLIATAQAVQ